jgi:hypothetical protein
MDSELVIKGAIVDSWVERSEDASRSPRVVLQVAPRGCPRDLMIVEASASLLPDRGWLDDLRENMCHGSPVAAVGRLTVPGQLAASHIQLAR